MRDELRPRFVRDVQDDRAARDVTDVGAVGPLREDVGVVRAVARVEFRMALQGRHGIADARARQPPAADFLGLRRLAHVDDAVELVVRRVRRLEVRGARRHVDVLAIDEPHGVHAARVLARGVEVRDELRRFRLADVEEIEARRLQVHLARLVRNRHHVADDVERVRAHLRVRQLGLHHHLEVLRIGDVDRGEVLRRRLVRHPQDPAPVLRELHAHALADAAEARELVVRQQLHVERQRLIGTGANSGKRRGHRRSYGVEEKKPRCEGVILTPRVHFFERRFRMEGSCLGCSLLFSD